MAHAKPSTLRRAPSTPPMTPTSIPHGKSEPSRPAMNLLTPPTSPGASRMSASPSLEPPILVDQGPNGDLQQATVKSVVETGHERWSGHTASPDILMCPFDVECLQNGAGQDQVLGYGAWSIVCKACMTLPSSPSSDAGLPSPPASPLAPATTVLAVKRPLRTDAIPVLRSEATILSYLMRVAHSSHYVVRFFGFVLRDSSLVMAALPCSLEDHIKHYSMIAKQNLTNRNIFDPVIGSPKLWLNLAKQMISALFWLHEAAGVVHGDIKPSNFLLCPRPTQTADEFPFRPVFIDFSSSHIVSSPTAPLSTLTALTREFTAPELLVSSVLRNPESTATKASDVFSLAVTLLVAATGETMVYPGSVFQRQAMATQGWQVLNFVRSGNGASRVPRNGLVEKVLERAVLKKDMGRIDPGKWLEIVEGMERGDPPKQSRNL